MLKKSTSYSIEPRVYELGTIRTKSDIFGLQIGFFLGRSLTERWSRRTKTLCMRLLAYQWKPPAAPVCPQEQFLI